MENKAKVTALNAVLAGVLRLFKPPEDVTLSQWADKRRVLSAESSAEAGPWRTSRTPYLQEPMDSFTDPAVQRIVVVAASQVGKTEIILNAIAYIIDQDPGSILFVHPTLDDAKKFSRQRIAPMVRDNPELKRKVADIRAKDASNTILQKTFPGGVLTMAGSNAASGLASIPARYVFGDERDRWAASAGTEGDPWDLATARQITFYNRKSIEVSTPTIKDASAIERSYYEGTQERWCHQCPNCGEYHELTFSRIKFRHEVNKVRGKNVYKLLEPPEWMCPNCACLSPEAVMRRQPAKWVAENPDALAKGVRSFWLNAFCSPWMSWDKIVLKFLDAKDDTEKLQVVYNTLLGELWENRGDVEDEDTLLQRREDYGTMEDGKTPVDLPEGVLVLTCAVDTQDNRLEYEVVGWGHYGESWGIRKGMIMGEPSDPDVWLQLDDIIDHVYRYKNGKGLPISITFVDSGGHYTTEVYKACRERQDRRVFAIKGGHGDGIPHVKPPNKIPIEGDKSQTCWLYSLGVDAGKAAIMASLKVQQPGPKYCHFPLDESRGYDRAYFNGLTAERLAQKKTSRGNRWEWVRIPGHPANEPLDLRNYNYAAFRVLNVDLEAIERRLRGEATAEPQGTASASQQKRRAGGPKFYSDL